MRVRFRDGFCIFLVKFMDIMQAGLLKSYAIFAFIASRAPQRFGAQACCYRAFKEFLIAYKHVPAYKDFLDKSGWSCKSANANEIFKSLPLTDKPNYILPYRTEERCLDGMFLYKGVVIDEKIKEKIFEPFYITGNQGKGPSLPIAYRIIKQHQGSMKIERRLGHGTEVNIYLPLTRPEIVSMLSIPLSASCGR